MGGIPGVGGIPGEDRGGHVLATTCFLEIFIHLTTELMLKNRIKAIVVSFNIFSVKGASLYNTLWPE